MVKRLFILSFYLFGLADISQIVLLFWVTVGSVKLCSLLFIVLQRQSVSVGREREREGERERERERVSQN